MKRKGFTLVELMLAVSVFSIFAFFMFKMFFDEQKFFMALHRQIDLQYNANTALEYIGGALRNNAGLAVNDTNYNIYYTDTTKSKVLIDLSGTLNTGEINLFRGDNTLKDNSQNTICRNVEEVLIEPYRVFTNDSLEKNAAGDIMKVTVILSSGSGSRRVDYPAETYINIKK
jgi:prepilin-type N-terminal cleavage/methylation domain-containing protein